MATEKWIAGSGQGLTWGAAMGATDPNSLANGNAIISTVQIDNSTALDIFCDISVSLGSITSGSGTPFIAMYIYPLNEDGTSYGDGRFGSSAAGPPPAQYYVGAIPCPASTTAVVTGAIRGIILPAGKFKFLIYNSTGAALATGSNVVDYRTYNRSVV